MAPFGMAPFGMALFGMGVASPGSSCPNEETRPGIDAASNTRPGAIVLAAARVW
jgi:hypothetical protein